MHKELKILQDKELAEALDAILKIKVRWAPVLKDMDKDRKASRQLALASKIGRKIRVTAQEAKIPLYGKKWVDAAPFQPHASRLTALFNSISHSPAYAAWQNQKREALIGALTAQQDFLEAASQWPLLEGDAHEALIREVSAQHHKIYGGDLYTPSELVLEFFSTAREGLEDEHYVRGSFGASMDSETRSFLWNMSFNTHPDTGFPNFLTAMNYVHHENTHAVQEAFAKLHAFHQIDPADELAGDALYWHEVRAYRHSYIPIIRPLYYNHPQEKDAFRQGTLFSTELHTALEKQGVSLPPAPPFP